MRNFYLTILFSLLSFSFNGLAAEKKSSINPYGKESFEWSSDKEGDAGSQDNSEDEEDETEHYYCIFEKHDTRKVEMTDVKF